MHTVKRAVAGHNGVRLAVHSSAVDGGRLTGVISHGLGVPRPTERHALNDPYTELLMKGLHTAGVGWVAQDVRGHGASGWDGVGDWRTLGRDVLAVAQDETTTKETKRVVLAGQSMGAVASVEAAMLGAEGGEGVDIAGLVLVRLPTMWDTRPAGAAGLRTAVAESLTDGPADARDKSVLLAAAATDLSAAPPAVGSALAVVPTLVLSVDNDATHPVSSAAAFRDILPHAAVRIAPDEARAFAEWPAVVADFVAGL